MRQKMKKQLRRRIQTQTFRKMRTTGKLQHLILPYLYSHLYLPWFQFPHLLRVLPRLLLQWPRLRCTRLQWFRQLESPLQTYCQQRLPLTLRRWQQYSPLYLHRNRIDNMQGCECVILSHIRVPFHSSCRRADVRRFPGDHRQALLQSSCRHADGLRCRTGLQLPW